MSTPIELRTLWPIVRASLHYLTRPPTRLAEASFAKLYAADRTDLPPAQPIPMRGGGSLAVRTYPSTARRNLILIHGSASHSGHLHALAQAIAAHGWARVWCPDMRGHGASVGCRPPGCSVDDPDQMCRDLADLLSFVRRSEATLPVILGGFSAGGGLAVRFAARPEADGIERLLLLAPYLGPVAPPTRPQVGGWVKPMFTRLSLVLALNLLGIRRLNAIPVIRFAQPKASRDGSDVLTWSLGTVLAFGPRDWRRDLSRALCRPTLLLVGDRDECFHVAGYQRALAMAQRAAEVTCITDCGHWDLLVATEAISRIGQWLNAPAE